MEICSTREILLSQLTSHTVELLKYKNVMCQKTNRVFQRTLNALVVCMYGHMIIVGLMMYDGNNESSRKWV